MRRDDAPRARRLPAPTTTKTTKTRSSECAATTRRARAGAMMARLSLSLSVCLLLCVDLSAAWSATCASPRPSVVGSPRVSLRVSLGCVCIGVAM